MEVKRGWVAPSPRKAGMDVHPCRPKMQNRPRVPLFGPFLSIFPRVLDKIVQDKAHAVILVPKWTKHKFFWKAWGLAVDAVMVPKVTFMFERNGKGQKGVPWDVYAFLVRGHVPPCPPCEVRGLPTPSKPSFEEEGAPKIKNGWRPPPPR